MATAVTPPPQDPWLDPFQTLGSSAYFEDISKIAAEDFGPPAAPAPDAPDNPGTPIAAEVLPVDPPPPPIEPELEDQPRVFEVDGGGKLTLEKGSKGWQATLDSGVPGIKDQVYYGKTKDELLLNFAKAQAHATKKIRSQDQKLKLGDPTPTAPATPQPTRQAKVRDLTADERFEYKTLLESDPVKALDYYNEKRYGLNPEEFAERLNDSLAAKERTAAIEADSVAYRFVDTNKDYFPDPEGKNYLAMVRYLGRQYLNKAIDKANPGKTVEELYKAGYWTLENLEAAKEDLSESGLLLTKPVAPTPAPAAPVPAAVTPQPPTPVAPAQPAIQPVERPRAANLGLRVTGSPPGPTPTPAPSVEDPSNMTDAEVEQALQNLKQSRVRGLR